MRLGNMLIRDARLSPAQLEAALAQQGRAGGRLGTILVEMKLIDADALTVYLGLELGIPIATRAALDRAKKAAVRLLTPEIAERFLCIPLLVQDRQLLVAMRDPHDLLALDELGMATGYRVIPRVAPEVRLHYYLERYYGVPRPDRFRALGDSVVAPPPRGRGDFVEPPPPPLPGLPPQVKNPVAVPPPPPLRTSERVPLAELVDYDELATTLAADSAEPMALSSTGPHRALSVGPGGRAAPAAAAAAAAAARVAAAASANTPPPAPPVAEEILDLPAALERMQEAASRSEVADAIVAHARDVFDVAVLLVVRDDLAVGWKGFGRQLDGERIESLLLPLATPSMFKTAAESAEVFLGAALPSALHAHLYKVLRAAAPRQAAVVPIVIRDRVVNLLYGHLEGEAVATDEQLAGLRRLAEAAGQAYVRLIALQKRAG
jgi:type II secretion system (T2SS) protein E